VSVVSPRNHNVFTPLLASASVGTLEFRCVQESIRPYIAGTNADFHLATCKRIDFQEKSLECVHELNGSRFNLQYDQLVISVGAFSNTFGIPGVRENAMFLKDVADAKKIRNKVLAVRHRFWNALSSSHNLIYLKQSVVTSCTFALLEVINTN
jgi:NADH dehydrogenase FAD-containing subunit